MSKLQQSAAMCSIALTVFPPQQIQTELGDAFMMSSGEMAFALY
jgi:hypothetical protein